ncbi:MFS transporter [Chloroflexota bacterium]
MSNGIREAFRQNEVLTILCVQILILMTGLGIVSPVLPLYARSFGVSITMVGLLITAFGLARLPLNIPAGHFCERFGRRWLLIAGPAVVALTSLGSGLATSFWQLLAFRIFQGAGGALHATAATIALADISQPANRGRTISLFQGSLMLGAGLGPVLGGVTAEHFGYRAPFFCYAFLAAIATIWAYLRIPETRQAQPAILQPGDGPGTKASRPSSGMRPFLVNPNFILVVLVTIGIIFTRAGAQSAILPLFADRHLGLSAGQIGLALSLVAAMNLATLFLAGALSDRLGRKAVIIPGSLLTGLSLVMFAKSGNLLLFLASAALLGVGTGVAGPAPAAYAIDLASPMDYGAVLALYRTVTDLGFVAGPVLLGWIGDLYGLSASLLVNAALVLATGFLFVLARETVRQPGKGVSPVAVG